MATPDPAYDQFMQEKQYELDLMLHNIFPIRCFSTKIQTPIPTPAECAELTGKALLKSGNIATLELYYTVRWSVHSAEKIQAYLATSEILQSLSLDGFGTRTFLPFLEAAEKNGNIKHLTLSRCGMVGAHKCTEFELEAVCSVLQNCQNLTFFHLTANSTLLDERDVAAIAEALVCIPALETISVHNFAGTLPLDPLFEALSLASTKSCHTKKRLILQNLPDHGFPAKLLDLLSATNSIVDHLVFENTTFYHPDAQLLSQCLSQSQTLTHLKFHMCRFMNGCSGGLVDGLYDTNSLKSLDFSVTQADFNALLPGFCGNMSLEELIISYDSRGEMTRPLSFGRIGREIMLRNKAIKKLKLQAPSTNEILSAAEILALAEGLRTSDGLECLEISRWQLNVESIRLLGDALITGKGKSATRLRELLLDSNGFGLQEIRTIAALIKHPDCPLESLTLKECTCIPRGGLEVILDALAQNQDINLRQLYLESCSVIKSSTWRTLGKRLHAVHGLRHLSVSTSVQDVLADPDFHLPGSVRTNSEAFNAAITYYGGLGAEIELLRGIKQNRSLETIDMPFGKYLGDHTCRRSILFCGVRNTTERLLKSEIPQVLAPQIFEAFQRMSQRRVEQMNGVSSSTGLSASLIYYWLQKQPGLRGNVRTSSQCSEINSSL